MSVLDKITIIETPAAEQLAANASDNEGLDPKRFDMCLLVRIRGEEQLAKFVTRRPAIEYLSNICDDFQINWFTYNEIQGQQIAKWLDSEVHFFDESFFIIQFTAKLMRYTKFLTSLTLILYDVLGSTSEVNLFWSVGGGFLGDYRYKKVTNYWKDNDMLADIWKTINWNLKRESFTDDIAKLFKDTASHTQNDDMDVYSKKCILYIKRVRDNKAKRYGIAG